LFDYAIEGSKAQIALISGEAGLGKSRLISEAKIRASKDMPIDDDHRTYPSFNYSFAVPGVVDFYRQNYGPIYRAFAARDAEGQKALRQHLEQVFSEYNRATDGTTRLSLNFWK